MERPTAQAPDSLARDLLLESDWLQTIRDDPRLPRAHLPADWPAGPAEELFHTLSDTWKPQARAIVAGVLDTIPDTQADTAPIRPGQTTQHQRRSRR